MSEASPEMSSRVGPEGGRQQGRIQAGDKYVYRIARRSPGKSYQLILPGP